MAPGEVDPLWGDDDVVVLEKSRATNLTVTHGDEVHITQTIEHNYLIVCCILNLPS